MLSDLITKELEFVVSDLWEEIREQLKDLFVALAILLKEAIFGLAVFAVCRSVAWLILHFSKDGDRTAALVSLLGDIGAVVLFLLLLIKDLRTYYRRR